MTLRAADKVAQSNRELGDRIIIANHYLGNKLETISKAEIKAKDRVDIPLSEYERMKNLIAKMEADTRHIQAILSKIEFPFDLVDNIIPGSVKTYYIDNPNPLSFDRIRRFRIEFDIDPS